MSRDHAGRFEGMVEARLIALEDRMDEALGIMRCIEERCRNEQAAHATLTTRIEQLQEKANFSLKVIWSAVAWIVVSALGMLAAAIGMAQ